MSLKVLIGPMFAGKSSALQSIIRRHTALGWRIFTITHSTDTRYSETPLIVSHDQQQLPAFHSTSLMAMLSHPEYAASRLVIVEEGQFFPDLVEFVKAVTDRDRKACVVVGLDGDSERRPFGHMLEIIPLAEDVVKYKALCKLCGDGTEAAFTFAHAPTATTVCVGGEERYVPLCRRHYLDKRYPLDKGVIDSVDVHAC